MPTRKRKRSPPKSESSVSSDDSDFNPDGKILDNTRGGRTRRCASFDGFVRTDSNVFKDAVSTVPESPLPIKHKSQYFLVRTTIDEHNVGEDQVLDSNISIDEKAWILQHLDILKNTPTRTAEHFDLKELIFRRFTKDTLTEEEYKLDKQMRTELKVHMSIRKQILRSSLPKEQKAIVYDRYLSVESASSDSEEYIKALTWISWALKVPQAVTPIASGPEHLIDVMSGLNDKIYGQNHVKERILDITASILRNPEGTHRCLALVGPPGTGKTAIAQLLAHTLGLPFTRLSLGGVNDVTALVGSTSTYVSSMPGLIVRNLCDMKSLSGVFFFDEFDKIPDTPEGHGVSNRMLHIIGATQNHTYEDLYLTGIKIDLSHLFFVIALNNEKDINPVLRDRLATIHMDPYRAKDKIEIAKRHFIPSIEKELNFEKGSILVSAQTIRDIVRYSDPDEPGVRTLERTIRHIWTRINTIITLQDFEMEMSWSEKLPKITLPFTLLSRYLPILTGTHRGI